VIKQGSVREKPRVQPVTRSQRKGNKKKEGKKGVFLLYALLNLGPFDV